ncbi:MAG TPA: hypothetical protein EYP16_03880, partial [Candidatus Atribacteria bacterium]|nr:hypothetical protein [Candidatus Atribacteria bacterium]
MSLEKIESLLLRLLDTSRTMIDLAYSALLYNDKVFAEEVLRLEEEVDELHTELELEVLKLKRREGEERGVLGLIRLGLSAEAISDAAASIADVDMKIGGQAVVYYQTAESGGDTTLFDQDNSQANAGLQLNANGDLDNGFGLGLQGTALSTWGLEKNLVSNVMQSGLGNNGDTANAGDYFAITKAYLTKKLGNTTLKMGRQELPKNLSPLAFSENWNVYKNTFDAILAVNSGDIPDTTLVGAYVSRSNQHG